MMMKETKPIMTVEMYVFIKNINKKGKLVEPKT
jgi:hypothetical protein